MAASTTATQPTWLTELASGRPPQIQADLLQRFHEQRSQGKYAHYVACWNIACIENPHWLVLRSRPEGWISPWCQVCSTFAEEHLWTPKCRNRVQQRGLTPGPFLQILLENKNFLPQLTEEQLHMPPIMILPIHEKYEQTAELSIKVSTVQRDGGRNVVNQLSFRHNIVSQLSLPAPVAQDGAHYVPNQLALTDNVGAYNNNMVNQLALTDNVGAYNNSHMVNHQLALTDSVANQYPRAAPVPSQLPLALPAPHQQLPPTAVVAVDRLHASESRFYRCANPNCNPTGPFLVNPDPRSGGYCCKNCFDHHASGLRGPVVHGPFCQQRLAPGWALQAPPVACGSLRNAAPKAPGEVVQGLQAGPATPCTGGAVALDLQPVHRVTDLDFDILDDPLDLDTTGEHAVRWLESC